MSTDAALSQQYQRKTDREHVLDNPDTYIGSVEQVNSALYVVVEESAAAAAAAAIEEPSDLAAAASSATAATAPVPAATTSRIVLKEMDYVPGLYKLFDEGIVNCRDHIIRMAQSTAMDRKLVSFIDVEVTPDGTISMTNDGNGIDVAMHPEYNIWIPELIFGHLRTSTNYNKDEERIVGGKNGFGFKLALIWSTYGRIETVDHVRQLKYVQEFRDNLTVIAPAVITKVAKSVKPYTKVTFTPDYARLRLPQGLTPDMMALLKKRVYDIAAVTDHSEKKVKVSFNGVPVPVKNFASYLDLYIGSKDSAKRVYESPDERWEYAVALSETHEFVQVSFVNGISTFKGGKHVEYIMGQITRKLVEYIDKKKKVRVNPASIKEQLILFLRCDIVNPSFDSQTKDFMNTPSNKFGSSCTVSDAFIEKVAKMGVMDLACSLTQAKESRMAAQKTDGAKTKTIRGIPNFVDANWGGTERSGECILILCEGLSAMSGVISGLSADDRNFIGVYPLKGKLLNVRGETPKRIAENKEITDLKKILGLENGREYTSMEEVQRLLRYGKVLVMTDQDLDGSHIKGLCINLFHSEWPSLTQLPGFLSFMNTPILRATRGAQRLLFYNQGEYDAWKATLPDGGSTKGWTIKYFKGLGTSTSTEFKEYFANKKIVGFVHDAERSNDAIDMVFNKKRPDDRKKWLEHYDKTAFLNTSQPEVTFDSFIHNEMIHFSTYDCARSIPNMVDGLKTSIRKILFCAFKRPLTSELKVAQFAAYVSEHSAYHHGEASLNGAIVAMAQNFVGSNNINLLLPNGQFGTRLQGGDDSASERYIFTVLNPLSRFLFPALDDAVLDYVDDDGTVVEPEYFVPILPFALVNGVSGIGTGFSSNIPPFHPMDLVTYLKERLRGEASTVSFVPYYEGFLGTVERAGDHKFLIRGVWERVDADRIHITELPIGTWTMPYITFLEGLVDGVLDAKTGKKSAPTLKDFKSVSTEIHVDITVQFPRGVLDTMAPESIEKLLKLTTTVTTSNMHLFNANCRLHKYGAVEEVIEDFCAVRLATYGKRKEDMVRSLSKQLVRLSNRARYILATLDGALDLRRMPNQAIAQLLEMQGYARIDGEFQYLVKMPMDSVSEENVAAILKEQAETEANLAELQATSCETMWLRELAQFEEQYAKYKQRREQLQTAAVTAPKAAIKRKAVGKPSAGETSLKRSASAAK